MIPVDSVRQAHRVQLENKIASQPSEARYRNRRLSVFTSEPQKTREMRQAGFDPLVELEVHIALPLGSKRPEAQLENIEVTDVSGETRTYRVHTVNPLRGLDCYRLGLKSNREVGASPSRFGLPRT